MISQHVNQFGQFQLYFKGLTKSSLKDQYVKPTNYHDHVMSIPQCKNAFQMNGAEKSRKSSKSK